MIATDEDALICDLAEYYNIYDYRSLPLQRIAVFSVGLREESRIKRELSGVKYTFETMLLASIVDHLNVRTWMMSEDGRNGINKPGSLVNRLLGKEEESGGKYIVFDTGQEFEKAWNEGIGKRKK